MGSGSLCQAPHPDAATRAAATHGEAGARSQWLGSIVSTDTRMVVSVGLPTGTVASCSRISRARRGSSKGSERTPTPLLWPSVGGCFARRSRSTAGVRSTAERTSCSRCSRVPRDGVAAAVAMQRAVAAAAWPDDGAVRVRIGLNVGDPVVADDVYVGLAVNRAARICSAGHGGQVLVSPRPGRSRGCVRVPRARFLHAGWFAGA